MKTTTLALACLAGLGGVGLGWSASARAAQPPPPGSYQLSCMNAKVAGDGLTASCQTLGGSYRQTTLAALDHCENAVLKGGDIGNIDGSLVCIPDLPQVVPGEAFPQSETTIDRWVYGGDRQAMWNHGWALWAGLTHYTGKVDDTPVRAFQTWATPSNMIYRTQSGLELRAQRGPLMLEKAQQLRGAGRLELAVPLQFRNIRPKLRAAQAVPDGDTNIFVGVAYNPAGAEHAITNKLFLQSTLNGYLRQGYTQIPVFPSGTITIKPVYKIVQAKEANGNVKDGIYTMPGWPGTPSPARTFPEQDWNACVYVDLKGKGPGGHAIDAGCTGRSKASTFHLDDFIYHVVTADEVAALSAQTGMTVSPGDYALLVGMHVGTRESTRWTWQTFWWSADPDTPYLPSDATIAQARPAVLDAAARHYAMAVAYQMVAPAQPINGGKSEGAAVIAYNPHLEAGFDPSVFQVPAVIVDGSKKTLNEYGVQTNCMTCHGLAQYQSTPPGYYAEHGGANRETPYAADFYFPLNDPLFKGKLQLDFAWSILGSLVLDQDGGNAGAPPPADAAHAHQ